MTTPATAYAAISRAEPHTLQSLWRGRICAPHATPRARRLAIIADVARKRHLTADDLYGDSRSRPIAHARQEAFWALHRGLRLSLPTIGRMFNRHHTTVLAGVRAHEKRMAVR